MPRVLNPAGGVQDVSEEQARELLALPGYSVAGPSAPEGGFAEQALAGAMGVGRGLSLGLSDVLPLVSGVPFTEGMGEGGNRIGATRPQEVRQLKEQFPVTSTIGEVAGTIAPTLLTGGAAGPGSALAKGALADVAQVTAPGLAGYAARAVQQAAMRGLGMGPTIRAVPGLAEEAAKRAIVMGAGSAVEGAIYGVGNAVSEAALGDPKKVAEHVVADVGLSAMLGLGLGAAGGALSELAPVAVGAAKNAAGKRAGKAIDYIREKYPKIAPLFGVEEDNARLLVNNADIIANNPEAREAVVKSVTQAVTDVEGVATALNKEMYRKLDQAVEGFKFNPEVGASETSAVLRNAGATLETMLADESLDRAAVRSLAKALNVAGSSAGLDVGRVERALAASVKTVEDVSPALADDLRKLAGGLRPSTTPAEIQDAVRAVAARHSLVLQGGPELPVVEKTVREVRDMLNRGTLTPEALEPLVGGAGPAAGRLRKAVQELDAVTKASPAAAEASALESAYQGLTKAKTFDEMVAPLSAIEQAYKTSGDELLGKAWTEAGRLQRAMDTGADGYYLSQARREALDAVKGRLGVLRAEVQKSAEAPHMEILGILDRAHLGARASSSTERAVLDVLESAQAAAKTPAEQFRALRRLKQDIDQAIPWDSALAPLSPAQRAAANTMKAVRSMVSASIHDAGKWGEAGALLSKVDEAHAVMEKARDPLIAGGGLFSKRKGLDAGPHVSYEAHPDKVSAWFRKVGTEGGEKRLQDLADYLDSSKALVEAVRDARAAVGGEAGELGEAAVKAVLGKTDEAVAEMRRTAAVQAAAKTSAGPDTLGVAGRIGAGAAASALGMGTGGFALGTLWAAHGFLRKPTAVATTLYTLEQSSQRISKTIDNMARAVINGSVKAHYVGRGEAAAGLSKVFGEDRKKSEKRFQQRMERVNEMASNVPYQTEILSKSLSQEAQGHAPKVDGELKATTLRAVQVLAESLPRKERRGPLAGPPMYSQTEISKFTRIYEALETPVSVMKQLAAGTLTADTVSAVKRVYPELYAAMSESLLKYHIERGSTPQSRAMLSVFLGTDVDGSFRPVASAATAASYAGPPEKGGGKSSSPKSDLTVASRMQTPVGQIAEGEKA